MVSNVSKSLLGMLICFNAPSIYTVLYLWNHNHSYYCKPPGCRTDTRLTVIVIVIPMIFHHCHMAENDTTPCYPPLNQPQKTTYFVWEKRLNALAKVSRLSNCKIYWLNYWHILDKKGMSRFTSNTLLIRIQYVISLNTFQNDNGWMKWSKIKWNVCTTNLISAKNFRDEELKLNFD